MNTLALKYELSVDDVVNFNYEHWKSPLNAAQRKKRFAGLVTTLVVGTLAGVALSMFAELRASSIRIVLLMTAVYAIIRLFSDTFFLKISIRNRVHKQLEDPINRKVLLPTELTITDEEIRSVDSTSESIYKWTSIGKVLYTDKYIFLFLQSIIALTIPKKELSADEIEKFSALIKEKIPSENIFYNK